MTYTPVFNDDHEASWVVGAGRKSGYLHMHDMFGPLWDLHMHSDVVVPSLIAKKKGKMGGRKLVSAFKDRVPQSAGIALFEYADLPYPVTGRALNAELLSRYMYSRLRTSGPAIRASRGGDKVAWIPIQKSDMEDAMVAADKNWARMLHHGPAQPLGVVHSQTTENTTVTMASPNSRTSAAASFFKSGVKYFQPDMYLMHVRAANGILGDASYAGTAGDQQKNLVDGVARVAKVESKSTSTPTSPTIVTSNALDITTYGILANGSPALVGDFLFPLGSRLEDMTAATYEAGCAGFHGLASLVSGQAGYTHLYGLQKTSYPTLAGVHGTNSGTARPFEEMLVTLVLDRINDEGRGKDPDTLVLHRTTRRPVVSEHSGERRFAPVQQGQRGFAPKLVHTAGDVQTPYVVDPDCLPGIVWCLRKETFGWYEEQAQTYLPDRFVVNKDAVESIWVKQGNVECPYPLDNGALDDVQYDHFALVA
jgi:hypothetical protein